MKKPAAILISVFIAVGLYLANHRQQEQTGGSFPKGAAPVVSGVPRQPAPSPSFSPKPQHIKVLGILNQIFDSKNDNDPRLDTEFRQLDPEFKQLLRDRYGTLAAEKRNERGTIVFLIGRELNRPEDFNFLCDVLRESPCQSLANCQGDPGSAGKEDFNRESGEEVTLAYPQLVAVKSLQKFLGQKSVDPALREAALKTVDCGRDSRTSIVLQRVGELNQELRKQQD